GSDVCSADLGRGEARPPLHERGKWIGPAPLLDRRVPHLRAEGSVHEGSATPHQAVGARVRCRCRAGAPGQKSGCDAYSPRDGRASVWYAEDADGATHFLMKTLPKVATEMARH